MECVNTKYGPPDEVNHDEYKYSALNKRKICYSKWLRNQVYFLTHNFYG